MHRALRGVTFCVFFTPHSIISLYIPSFLIPIPLGTYPNEGYTWYRTVHKPLAVVRRRRPWLVGWLVGLKFNPHPPTCTYVRACVCMHAKKSNSARNGYPTGVHSTMLKVTLVSYNE